MSPPPYITIPLCPLHTASTGLTFLHQRTMVPPHHIPPPYTTNPLHTVSTASSGLTFLHKRQCPHNHIPLTATAYCIHCVLHPLHPWFDLFLSKTMSPPPYTTILLCPLHTASTALTASTASTVYCVYCVTTSTESTGLMFLHQRQCLLCPLCTVSTVSLCTVSTV